MANTVIRGMVRVEGFTYRVVRNASRSYSIVRITDDLEVGTFQTGPLKVRALHVDAALLREIAVQAIRLAKTSMVTNLTAAREERPALEERFQPSSRPPPSALPA